MEKQKKSLKILAPFALVSALFLGIAISCMPRNEETKHNVEQEKNISLSNNLNVAIKGEVKYVAFGDSITAGFNSELGSEAPGLLDEKGNFSGLSYPAFMAEMINDIQPGKLASFENFALSGTRVVDWLYILGEPNENYDIAKESGYFDFLLNLDKNENNLYKGRVEKQFKNFGKTNPEDFAYFREQVQNANLLTISLGANDLIAKMPWLEIYDLVSNSNSFSRKQKSVKINQLFTRLNSLSQEVYTNLLKLNIAIKKLNPDANVTYVGYPMPLLRLSKILDSSFDLPSGKTFSATFLEILNGTVQKAATESGLNYVATYDEDDWQASADKLSKVFYDIHPTAKGYKKMAQDILLKMSLSGKYDDVKKRQFKIARGLVKQWDYAYFEKDKSSFNQQISFNDASNSEIVKKVLGSKNLLKLWIDSTLESNPQIIKALKNGKLSNIIRNWVNANKDKVISMADSAADFLQLLDLDPDKKLTNFIKANNENGDNNFFEMAKAISSSTYIDSVVNGIQNDLDNLDLDKNDIPGTQSISCEILSKLTRKHALNKDNAFSLVKDVLVSNFFEEKPQQAKELVKSLLQNVFNSEFIIKSLFSAKSFSFNIAESKKMDQNFDVLIKGFKKNKHFKIMLDKLVDDLFAQKNTYVSQSDIFAMLSLFVKNNEINLSTNLTLTIEEFLKDDNNVNSLATVIEMFIGSSLKLSNNHVVEKEQIRSFIAKFLRYLPQSEILRVIKGEVIEKLSNKEILENVLLEKSNNTISFKSDNLLSLFEFGTQKQLIALFRFILDERFTNQEIIDVAKIFMQRMDFTKLSSIISGKDFDLLEFLKSTILSADLTEVKKEKFKSLITGMLDNLTTGAYFEPVMKLIADKLTSNVFLLIREKIDNESIIKNAKRLHKLISLSIQHLIKSNDLKHLFSDILDDLFVNKNKYSQSTSVSDLLFKAIKGNIKTFKNSTDSIINSLFTNQAINEEITDLIFELSTNLVLKESVREASETEQAKFKDFIKNVLPNISKISFFQNAKELFFEFIDENLKDIFAGKGDIVSNLERKLSQLNIDVSGLLKSGIETIEFESLTLENFADFFDFLGSYTSFEKINKLINDLSQNSSASKKDLEQQLLFALNVILKSKTFISQPQEPVAQEQVRIRKNVDKVRGIAKLIFEKLLVKPEMRQSILDALTNKFGRSLQQVLQLDEKQTRDFITNFYDSIIADNSIKDILDVSLEALFANAVSLPKFTSIEGVIATIFQYQADALKPKMDQFVKTMVQNQSVQEQLMQLLFNAINPNRDYQSLPAQSKNKLRNFINQVSDNIDKVQLYNEFLNGFVELLKNENSLKQLFRGDAHQIKAKIKDIFDYQDASSIAKIVQIMEIEEISAQSWADVATIIINRLNINASANNTNSTSPKTSNKDASLTLLQEMFKYPLSNKGVAKLKAITKILADNIINSSSILQDVLTKYLSAQANPIIDNFISEIPELNSLNDEYKQFSTKLFSKILGQKQLKTTLVNAVQKMIDNRLGYTDSSINTWGKFTKKFWEENGDELSNQIDPFATGILNDVEIKNQLISLVKKSALHYLKISDSLNSVQEQNFNQVIQSLLNNFPKLTIYQNLKTKVKTFIAENIEALVDGSLTNAQLKTKLNQIINFEEIDLITLFDIFEFNDLSANQISTFLNTFLSKISQTRIEELLASSTATSSLNADKALSVIKKILNSKYFNSSAIGADAAKIRANKTKAKEVLKSLVAIVFETNGISSYVKNKINQMVAPQLQQSVGVSLLDAQEFSTSMFNFIKNNAFIRKQINNFVDDLIDNSNKYATATNITTFANTFFTQAVLQDIENNLDSIVKSLLADPGVGKFLAKVIAVKFKLAIPASEQNGFVEVVQALLEQSSRQITKMPFWNSLKNNVYSVFRTRKLAAFTTQFGQNEIFDAIEALNLVDLSKMLDLIDFVDDDRIKPDTIGLIMNYIFKYSPLPNNIENATAENNPIFYLLNNINKDPDVSKRTSLSLLNAVSQMGGVGSQGEALTAMVKKLYSSYVNWEARHNPGWHSGYNRNNPYYQAIYRLGALSLWYAWESYSREGSRLLFWNSTNSTVEGYLYGYMTENADEKLTEIVKSIFGNRGVTSWWGGVTYPKYSNYKANDLLWMIYYYDGKDNYGKTASRLKKYETIKQTIMRYIQKGDSDI